MEMRTGQVQAIAAKAVVLATGGLGRVYQPTTNSLISTGDGMSLAYRAGAPLMDMEFVQFHPTTLKDSGVLLTEGARGEGAYLLNSLGERFMARYAPQKMELAPRDVVSRAEQTEIDEGRGVDGCVLLDLRHLGEERIRERLWQIHDLAQDLAGRIFSASPSPCGPACTTTWAASRPTWTARLPCPASSPPASAPASRCTARTAWAATRCWRRWSSVAAPGAPPPSTPAGVLAADCLGGRADQRRT